MQFCMSLSPLIRPDAARVYNDVHVLTGTAVKISRVYPVMSDLKAALGPKPASKHLKRALDPHEDFFTPLDEPYNRGQTYSAFVQGKESLRQEVSAKRSIALIVLDFKADASYLQTIRSFISTHFPPLRTQDIVPSVAETRYLRRRIVNGQQEINADDAVNIIRRKRPQSALFALCVSTCAFFPGGSGPAHPQCVRIDASTMLLSLPDLARANPPEQVAQTHATPPGRRSHSRRDSATNSFAYNPFNQKPTQDSFNPFAIPTSPPPQRAVALPLEQKAAHTHAVDSTRELARVVRRTMLSLFGLPPCVYYKCVLNDPEAPSPAMLCPVDLRKLQYVLQFDPVKRYQAMLVFYDSHANAFPDEKMWLSERIQVLTIV